LDAEKTRKIVILWFRNSISLTTDSTVFANF
jgi:hypothetical protein